jgi:hypothetical protein
MSPECETHLCILGILGAEKPSPFHTSSRGQLVAQARSAPCSLPNMIISGGPCSILPDDLTEPKHGSW